MAIRSYITVDWDVNPRIITVAATEVEVSMQDLLDTLSNLEAMPGNMDELQIVDAAGKEDLGDGVKVGLTVSLLDAQLAFESRPGPDYSQCRISGGNLVAVDANGLPISAIHPTAFTQVILANSSSATLIETGVSGLTPDESNQLSSIGPAIQDVKVDTELISAIENGRWLIQNNQQIFFKPDNVTEICRFNLLDASGSPTETGVYERIRV